MDNSLPDIEAIKAALIKGFTEGLGITAEEGEITVSVTLAKRRKRVAAEVTRTRVSQTNS